MNKIISNENQKNRFSPQKMYTQQEIDDSYQKGKDSQIVMTQNTQADENGNKKSLDKNLVASLVRKSNEILVSISSYVFPFNIFCDTINVEEGRITIITRSFLFSSQVHSVDIKDISNIFINVAPFFAELVIVSKTYENNLIKIKYLRKNEAIFARRIIEGLRIFKNNNIDTSGYTRDEFIKKLEELSTTKIVT